METTLSWLWFTHRMRHLEASTGKHTLVLIILLAPAIFRCGTATISARFGHGRSGIEIADKEKHRNMGNVLQCCCIIAFRNLSLVEEYVLDRARNLNSLAAIEGVDVESSEGRYWFRLGYLLHLGLGRSWLRSNWT